ncbi:MAG: hypothetical protein VXW99_11670, partial [Pseudomonadota bacterium]|nr:hypothetical protein [Pseudomonadota bacterium]
DSGFFQPDGFASFAGQTKKARLRSGFFVSGCFTYFILEALSLKTKVTNEDIALDRRHQSFYLALHALLH